MTVMRHCDPQALLAGVSCPCPDDCDEAGECLRAMRVIHGPVVQSPHPEEEDEVKIFKTTVIGMGPWCIEFPDGEIVTCRTEDRARLIARCRCADKGNVEPPSGSATPPGLERLYKAAGPFVRLVKKSSGRIPAEKLAACDWHELVKAFDEATHPQERR